MAVAYGQMGIHVREEYIVLGLDPGRDKTGFAFVDSEGRLIVSGIFPSGESERFFAAVRAVFSDGSTSLNSNTDTLSEFIIEQFSAFPENLSTALKFIAIGNGTYSKSCTLQVRNIFTCKVLTVDEHNTTLEARGLYWKLHKPNFWMRLIPEGLRVPSRVLDDLAAWAIALRGLKKYRDINQNRL